MGNHDTALVIALWAVAAITYGLVLLHNRAQPTVDELVGPELTDTEIDAEFAALTGQLDRPYDHETEGL